MTVRQLVKNFITRNFSLTIRNQKGDVIYSGDMDEIRPCILNTIVSRFTVDYCYRNVFIDIAGISPEPVFLSIVGCGHHHSELRNGRARETDFYVQSYKGEYGKGYIVHRPTDGEYYIVDYYIEDVGGGRE